MSSRQGKRDENKAWIVKKCNETFLRYSTLLPFYTIGKNGCYQHCLGLDNFFGDYYTAAL